jgi:hypothetical protein
MTNNNSSNENNKGGEGEKEKFVRICDCETGRFLTSLSKKQIEIIYDTIVKAAIDSGDWITDPMKELVIQTVTELKEHISSGADERLP